MNFYTDVSRRGNFILYRGYKNGKPVQSRVKFSPTLFVQSGKKSDYRSLIGDRYVTPIEFQTMSDANRFIEENSDVSNRPIYGNKNYVFQFIQRNFPNKIKFDVEKINIVSFDIEVDISTGFANIQEADKEITSISFKSSKSDTYHLLGRKDYDKNKTITGIDPEKIHYMKFDREDVMLRRFIEMWKNNYPDIVTGWNVEFFDIAYLLKRVEKVLGEGAMKEFSPWGWIREKKKDFYNKTQVTYNIAGIAVIDYMDTFKKFGRKYGSQSSYKLDHIANVVLGEKKLSYEEYGSLTQLYEQNPQLYLDYNLKDTHLIQRLEDETRLLELVMTVAYDGGVNFSDAFGTVGIWESIIYRRLMLEKVVPNVKKDVDRNAEDLVGGYVKDPVPGMYKWVVSFDLNSLYPHLMLQYNMSPETIEYGNREGVSQETILDGSYQNYDKNFSVCPNGVKFKNEKIGVIPKIIDEYYANRKRVKNEMLEVEKLIESDKGNKSLRQKASQLYNEQMAIKIAMNALYGATANKYFLYYIVEMAEAITTSGQLSIRCAEKSVNDYLKGVLKTDEDYIIYMDTDSIYVNMEPLIKEVFGDSDISRERGEAFLDKVCSTKIEDAILRGYEKLSQTVGAFRNAMVMKREKITDKTIFIAKKRYILSVLNSEGVRYEEPKISVTGIESVRSSTPQVCRDKLEEGFRLIMNTNEERVQRFISEFKKQFFETPVEDIARISGTDDIEKYIKDEQPIKGCPMHVRGCIVFNNFLRQRGLQNSYEMIQSGDKIKMVYLKMPNETMGNVISFPNVLPREFNLDAYIDRQTQFEKVFLGPLESILSVIGWQSEKRNDLMAFFK